MQWSWWHGAVVSCFVCFICFISEFASFLFQDFVDPICRFPSIWSESMSFDLAF